MAKKTLGMPTYDRMLWPALQALKDIGGSASIQEHLDRVAELMGLPDEVQEVLHKDGPSTEVAYRLAWARTYLKKAGAVENSARGVWSITPAGRKLTEVDVAAIPAQVRKTRSRSVEEEEEEAVEATWQDELLALLKEMPPDAFERLAQRILREAGFVKVEVTGRSGDGGIDGIGVLRLNNLMSFHVIFQCKRYKDVVGPGVIRDFRGAMVGRTDKALLITTGRFTPEATKEAGRDGAPPIELVDGERLCRLLKELKLGVKTEWVEEVSVAPDFFNGL